MHLVKQQALPAQPPGAQVVNTRTCNKTWDSHYHLYIRRQQHVVRTTCDCMAEHPAVVWDSSYSAYPPGTDLLGN